MVNFKVKIVRLFMSTKKQNISEAFKMVKNAVLADIIMAMEEFGKDNGKTTDRMVMASSKIKKELSLKDIGLMA